MSVCARTPVAAEMAVMSGAPAPPPSAMHAHAMLSKLNDSYRSVLARQKPWSEVTDRSTFAKPESLNDALSRIQKNLGYFQANYLTILLAVVVISMLWNPTSVFFLAVLALAWVYLFMIRTEPVVIANRQLSEREKFLGMVLISIVTIFGLTSVGSVLMSGVVIGSVAIIGHAALRVPDDLFTDDSDAGFLSFLNGRGTQIPSAI